MKCYLLLFFAVIFSFSINAQTFTQLLENGKDIIKKARAGTTPEKPDYSRAVASLQQAVKLEPNNQEAHYFLGSAYDYQNNPDCSTIITESRDGAITASNEFETVIRISPEYKGEIIALDPYTKLSSIWGCLAFGYMAKGLEDSAKWAFREGKMRGAFSDFALAYYREVLNTCSHGAIYFTCGDFSTMNTWYLQEMEGYRTDVVLMSQSMTQIPWITEFYYKKHPDLFSAASVASDTMLYGNWEDRQEIIEVRHTGKFLRWHLKPTLDERYIMRSDVVMMDILKTNGFERDVYFEKGSAPESILSLNEHLEDCFLLDKLVRETKPERGTAFYNHFNTFPFGLINKANTNSSIEVFNINVLRYEFVYGIAAFLDNGKKEEAKKLYNKMDVVIPQSKFPITADDVKSYLVQVQDYLK